MLGQMFIDDGLAPSTSGGNGPPGSTTGTIVRQKAKTKGLAKHLATSEAMLQLKLREYHTALQERERLLKKLGVLEAVLPSLTATVQAMAIAGHDSAARSGPSASHPAQADGNAPQQAGTSANRAIHTASALDDYVLAGISSVDSMDWLTDEQLLALPLDGVGAAADSCSSAAPSAKPASSSQSAAFATDLSVAEARQVMAQTWSTAVRDMGFLLSLGGLRPAGPDRVALQRVWDNVSTALRPVGAIQPDAWFSLIGVNLETGRRDEGPGPDHWPNVVRVCPITPRQEAHVRATLAFHDERMQSIMEERRALKHQLELATANGAASSSHMSYLEVSHALRANIRTERFNRLAVMMSIAHSPEFTVVQNSTMAVASWPYIPDTLTLCHMMAQQADAQQAAAAAAAVTGM